MSRGNDRRDIVRDDRDREERLYWLQRTVEVYGWRLHAFALMRNHEYLFVETPRANLSAGMQFLNGGYTSYFNRRHRRVGHLFQGRFKGQLIEECGYFLEVSRYIHLAPVRAKVVERPEDYPWSSYQGYVRARHAMEWMEYGRVLGELGKDERQARRGYARFVRAGVDDPPQSPFSEASGGLVLGSARFIERICDLLEHHGESKSSPELRRLRGRPSLDRIVAVVARHFGSEKADWLPGRRSDDLGRAAAAYLARRRFGHSGTETAAALGYRSASSVSHAIRRIEGDKSQRRILDKIASELT
jgi:REP element-mobilizing transposase RayT